MVRRVWSSAAILLAACGRIGFAPSSDASSDASSEVGPNDGAPLDATASIVANLEAESGALVAPFELVSDPAVSGGTYLLDNDPQGLGGPGRATFTFTISEPATRTYYVWGRTLAPDQSRDSFFVSIDGAETYYDTSGCMHGDQWQWTALLIAGTCPNSNPQVGYSLAPGVHTLQLRSREGLSAIDRILVGYDANLVAQD